MAVSLKYNVFCHTTKTVQEWLKEHDKEFKMLTPDPNANSISNNATHKKQRIHCQHPLAKHHSTHTEVLYLCPDGFWWQKKATSIIWGRWFSRCSGFVYHSHVVVVDKLCGFAHCVIMSYSSYFYSALKESKAIEPESIMWNCAFNCNLLLLDFLQFSI